jgi:DNA-binding transcriptional MerR regulator
MKMQRKQFRIGDLAKQLNVERFVIRFWEKEFNLKAIRSKGGQRFYEGKDLATFEYIKELLYKQGFTIAGAKQKLNLTSKKDIIASKRTTFNEHAPLPNDIKKLLLDIRARLVKLQKVL